ncbi:MAG TPA: flagellar motor protein MotD, partial [Nevskiaceae bacterium]|nr:flagellar motor protein MotD [Nevskiaceae bacterium]
MAKHKHEEHQNHEAWAIPYGDLVTLLLALFVVMYAVSSVNEGKFRVLAESMAEAFGGAPRSIAPIQVGEKISKGSDNSQKMSVLPSPSLPQALGGVMRSLSNPRVLDGNLRSTIAQHQLDRSGNTGYKHGLENLQHMGDQIRSAMGELIGKQLVIVRQTELWLEVEIKTDILFPSGVARVDDNAVPVLTRLAGIMQPFPNSIRVEGYTDNVPISTYTYPSNWELPAARAASVVRLFIDHGVDPKRMSVAGLGEYRPVADNDTPTGRNRNRRVVLVVLADNGGSEPQAINAALQPG